MRDELEELPPWSRVRWSVAVLLLALLHLGALFALSDLGPARTARVPDPFVVRLFTEPRAATMLLDTHALNDPTLLAAVNRRGFSGHAWLNIEPPAFRLPEWRDRQRWLTQDTTGLGLAFREYVRTNLVGSLSVARPPAPPAPAVGRRPDLDQADVFVTGDLMNRPLLERPKLNALPAPDLLLPTTIEVLVDRDGYVFSPRLRHRPLIASAEQAAAQGRADQRAIALTRELRFTPVTRLPASDEFPFSKGEVTFTWITSPAAAASQTNR